MAIALSLIVCGVAIAQDKKLTKRQLEASIHYHKGTAQYEAMLLRLCK